MLLKVRNHLKASGKIPSNFTIAAILCVVLSFNTSGQHHSEQTFEEES